MSCSSSRSGGLRRRSYQEESGLFGRHWWGFRYRSVIYLSLAGLLTFLCYGGTLSFISDMLSLAPLSFSPENIGIIMAGAGIAGMFIAPIGGMMVDRLGRLWAAGIGLSVMIVAFFMFTQANSFFSSSVRWRYSAPVHRLSGPRCSLSPSRSSLMKKAPSLIFNSARYSWLFHGASGLHSALCRDDRCHPPISGGHSRLGAGSNIPCCEEF